MNKSTVDPSRIPKFPKIVAQITEDGTGEVSTNGISQAVTGEGIDDVRARIIAEISDTATKIGRPVRATTTDPSGVWPLIIHPDGTVEQDDQTLAKKRTEQKHPAPAGKPSTSKTQVHEQTTPVAPAVPETPAASDAPLPPVQPPVQGPLQPPPDSVTPSSPSPGPPHQPSKNDPPPVTPAPPKAPQQIPPAPVPSAGQGWWIHEPGQPSTLEGWKYSAQQWEEAINENNQERGFNKHINLMWATWGPRWSPRSRAKA